GPRRRERDRAPPLHRRPLRPRPDHPDERRDAAVRLPAVAVEPQRVLLHRRLLACVPRARLPSRGADVPAARAEVRALTRTHAERVRSTDGYFGPDSMIRRLGNTPLTPMLGGG